MLTLLGDGIAVRIPGNFSKERTLQIDISGSVPSEQILTRVVAAAKEQRAVLPVIVIATDINGCEVIKSELQNEKCFIVGKGSVAE
jgi:hypothetical protein